MSGKDILKNLIAFNTIEDKDNQEIINYIEKQLSIKGFRTEYKSKCLIMSIKNNYKMGFLGHTDTVNYTDNWDTNPFELEERADKLYGLGICDMKGGIAGFIQAILETNWEELKYGIKVYFTYDEEIGFSGIKELIKVEKEFPENMYIGEPSNNTIMNASKGLLELKIAFNGKCAHSSTPNNGENAIENSIEFINDLKVFYNDLKKDKNDKFEIEYTTMNIGKIRGGERINVVPDYCEMFIDFRVIKNEHIDLILNKINELTQKYSGNYSIINKINSFVNEEEQISPINFITEASFVGAKNRYILGVGPINPHEANEHITINSLDNLVKQYKEIIHKYCSNK